jgi:hypothetical protein
MYQYYQRLYSRSKEAIAIEVSEQIFAFLLLLQLVSGKAYKFKPMEVTSEYVNSSAFEMNEMSIE